MAAAQYFDQVQKIYIAFYQRPADPAGLKYWAGEVDKAGGSLTAVMNAFASEPESLALYGNIDASNIGDVLDKVYLAAFGHKADEAGKAFYVDGFNAGTFTPGAIALLVLEGALGTDATSVANKLTVANEFTKQVDGRAVTDANFGTAPFAVTYGGEPDSVAARGMLAGVTESATTVLTAAQVTNVLKTQIADPSDPINDVTLTLTTGVDTFSPTATDALSKTTDGNDTIKGVSATLTSEKTLGADDNIDGGKGNDTLEVDMQANFNGFTANVGGMKNVETVKLTNTSDVGRTFTATGVTGATHYELNGNLSLAELANTTAAVTLNGTQKATTIAYATDVTKGTTDAQTINLNGVGTAKVEKTATEAEVPAVKVAITAAGIETLNLTTKGVNVVDLAGVAAAKDIVVAGAGTLDTNVAAATKTFDASANTGAVKVDVGNAAAGAITTVATGAGDDTIIADVAKLAVNTTIAGGAGTNDRLELNVSTSTTTQYQMSGVETISLEAIATAGLTFSATKASGIKTIEVTDKFVATGAGQEAQFVSMGAGALAFNLKGANATAAAKITSDHSGASSVNVVASKEATKTTPDANNVALTLDKSTGLTLNVGEFAQYTGTITATKATSVESTGTLTGTAALTLVAATSGVFKTTETSAVSLVADKMTSLDVTAADGFTLATASSLAKLEGLNVAIAKGTFDAAINTVKLAAVNTVTLSGAGKATLDDLGTTTLGYGINVKASGLTAATGADALTINKIEVGAGQAINLNVAGVLGGVTLTAGATVAPTAGKSTGSITINADGTTGTVKIGGTAAGSGLVAKTVTVNAAGALGEVADALGTGAMHITADTVTFTGSSLKANKADILASTGATVLTATLNGGIVADTFKVDGDILTTTIKVSGDLGIGTNAVDVDASAQNVTTTAVSIDVSGVKGALATTTTTVIGSAGKDTIKGSAGNDVITGGTGADVINVGAGTDKVIYTAAGETGAFTVPATNTISTTTFDVITGMAAGDTIQGVAASALTIATATTLIGLTAADNTASFVRGTYTASTNTFVGSATGNDSLFVADVDATATVTLEAVVLVGFVDTATATATAGGLFTLA